MGNNGLTLQDSVILRYRRDDHVRFELPAVLCSEWAAKRLEHRLGEREGVYRVIVYRRYNKLSIRYLDDVCGFQDLALMLNEVITEISRELEQPKVKAQKVPERKTFKDRFLELPLVQQAKAKYQHGKAMFEGASTVIRAKLGKPSGPPMSTEKLAINFLNDLVSFYLIKLHWERITKEWLKEPLKYRYQWLTAFYLVFLMVRYRKTMVRK